MQQHQVMRQLDGTYAPDVDWERLGNVDHFVQFYENDGILAESVVSFMNASLKQGKAGIVIATAERRAVINAKLASQGVNVEAVRRNGQFVSLDAAEMLAQFMVNGMPDAQRFQQTIGEVVARLTHEYDHLRAFDEMVALLWSENNQAAAIRLEALWNELGTKHAFSLFCAYPLEAFANTEQSEFYTSVCGCHTQVIPTENYTTLSTSEERLKAISLLQQKALSLEAEIAQRKNVQQELLLALESAQAAGVAKTDFLANMSHELRTPLNAVIGLSELLQLQDTPVNQQHEYMKTLQLSAQQLLALVNDMLDVSKLEAQKLQLESIPFDIQDIIGELVNIHSVEAHEKGIQLLVRTEASTSMRVLGDPFRLRQALDNLVNNALKFTETGQVAITTRFQLRPHDKMVDAEITVTDTGIGIEAQKMQMIFGKFNQGDTSITRKYGGTGLGLTITKTLVEMMKGSIEVESGIGNGSRFTIRLAFPKAEEDATITPIAKKGTAPLLTEGHHILLVEDYPANILVATTMLSMMKCTYEVAVTGVEAVEKIKQKNFDYVLMDVQMPEMDGLCATRTIREWEIESGTPRTPIIGMTAHALRGDKERCLASGMDDYISKPFLKDELEEKLGLTQPS